MCIGTSATVHIWVSKDYFEELFFHFYLIGPGNPNPVIRLGNKHNSLNHLKVPSSLFLSTVLLSFMREDSVPIYKLILLSISWL